MKRSTLIAGLFCLTAFFLGGYHIYVRAQASPVYETLDALEEAVLVQFPGELGEIPLADGAVLCVLYNVQFNGFRFIVAQPAQLGYQAVIDPAMVGLPESVDPLPLRATFTGCTPHISFYIPVSDVDSTPPQGYSLLALESRDIYYRPAM